MGIGDTPFTYDSIGTHYKPIYEQIFSAPIVKTLGAPTTLSVNAVVDTYTLEITPGHAFIAGDFLALSDVTGNIYLGTIINVSTNTLTMDNPINYSYQAVTSVVIRATREMNVNGSVTPEIFSIGPQPTPSGLSKWSIHRLILTMICDTNPDDGLFGNLASLTRGVVFRVCRNGEERLNKANFKNNSDIAEECFDVTYTTRSSGGGDFGVRARITFGGQEKHGTPVSLSESSNDVIEFIIQDDLRNLISFRANIQGHID